MTSAPETIQHASHIERAASWLSDQPRQPAPVISTLQSRFDLTHDEAHQAVVIAGRMRMLREAFA